MRQRYGRTAGEQYRNQAEGTERMMIQCDDERGKGIDDSGGKLNWHNGSTGKGKGMWSIVDELVLNFLWWVFRDASEAVSQFE